MLRLGPLEGMQRKRARSTNAGMDARSRVAHRNARQPVERSVLRSGKGVGRVSRAIAVATGAHRCSHLNHYPTSRLGLVSRQAPNLLQLRTPLGHCFFAPTCWGSQVSGNYIARTLRELIIAAAKDLELSLLAGVDLR
jgi:hypothetical protein